MSEPENLAGSEESRAHSALARDLAEAVATPAIYVNRFFFTGMGPNVRLTFAEQNVADNQTHMRVAVVASVTDACQLRDLLVNMLQGVQLIDLPQSGVNG